MNTATQDPTATAAQEDRWMLASGFTADNCHSLRHQSVLVTLPDPSQVRPARLSGCGSISCS